MPAIINFQVNSICMLRNFKNLLTKEKKTAFVPLKLQRILREFHFAKVSMWLLVDSGNFDVSSRQSISSLTSPMGRCSPVNCPWGNSPQGSGGYGTGPTVFVC